LNDSFLIKLTTFFYLGGGFMITEEKVHSKQEHKKRHDGKGVKNPITRPLLRSRSRIRRVIREKKKNNVVRRDLKLESKVKMKGKGMAGQN